MCIRDSPHGFGAPPSGWLVLRVKAAAPVSICETAADRDTLTLTASGPCEVVVWMWP